MQRSLYTAVSGVKEHQRYLDVTGHNMANVNTVGYKRDVLQFADTISQLIRNEQAPVSPPGGINPAQVGLGVRNGSISPNFVQGSFQNTGIPSDMAVQGEGFFIVNDGSRNLYTRAGNFSLDLQGNLVMQGTGHSGYLVQGYRFNGTEMETTLSGIVIPVGHGMAQKATTVAAFKCNLFSGTEARIADPEVVPVEEDKVLRPFAYNGAEDLSASASSQSSQTDMDAFGDSMIKSHDWRDSFAVYDASGTPRVMTVVFRKVFDRPADVESIPARPAESEWDWYAYYENEFGMIAPEFGQGGGTLVFNDMGILKRTYAFDPSGGWGVIEKNIPADDAPDDGRPTGLVGANFDGPGAPITLDFFGRDYAAAEDRIFGGVISGVSSFGTNFTTKMAAQDGYPAGTLRDWSVSDYGIITGEYTNGRFNPIAQVPLARFINPQGLFQVSTTCFAESSDSGPARIMNPGENGAGFIKGRTIEMSNVDLAEEFVNLIRSQRGLQANSRAVTTSDRFLETLINLKR